MKTLPLERCTRHCTRVCAADVVIRPLALASAVPQCISMKHPVPWVFFARPAEKQAWPKNALLVAGDAGDRRTGAEQVGPSLTEDVARPDAPRGTDTRDVEQREQFVVPGVAVDVEEHRARGVADVGGVHRRR